MENCSVDIDVCSEVTNGTDCVGGMVGVKAEQRLLGVHSTEISVIVIAVGYSVESADMQADPQL